jgi:hypothetical protein
MKNNADSALIFDEDLICPVVDLHSSKKRGCAAGDDRSVESDHSDPFMKSPMIAGERPSQRLGIDHDLRTPHSPAIESKTRPRIRAAGP